MSLGTPDDDEKPSARWLRVPPVVLAVVLLFGVLGIASALTLVTGAADQGGDESSADAPGSLRGERLPDEISQEAAPRIMLDDANGLPLDSRDLVGRPYLVTFVYTRCPDVCPLIGQQVREALHELGPAGRAVTVLFVSVDPGGDTPDAARTWLRRQRMPGNVRYLVGTERELEPVWSRYFAAPQNPSRPETSTHSAAVWLIDDEGRPRVRHPAGDGISPTDLAHDVRALLGEQPDAPGA